MLKVDILSRNVGLLGAEWKLHEKLAIARLVRY